MSSITPVPRDRQDVVATILRDRPGITAAQLAEELDVSVRSVFRDLDSLRERGYPIESARGRGGGLRLRGNWGLGRVLMSREEALCTLLGLVVSERLGLPVFSTELAAARRKIADAFPSTERRRIAPLRERIFVGGAASSAVRNSYTPPPAGSMRQLQLAFVQEQVVSLTYIREDGTRSVRRVEPHALIINVPAWYLLGYDNLRARPRTFRLDRVQSVEREAVGFRPRAHDLITALAAETGASFERV